MVKGTERERQGLSKANREEQEEEARKEKFAWSTERQTRRKCKTGS
jgi:hypothetical protein